MIGSDGFLTEAEKEVLRANKGAEFFRIARKAIGQQWRYSASRITKINRDELERAQGMLAGLECAYNVLMAVVMEDGEKKPESSETEAPKLQSLEGLAFRKK